MSQTRKVSGVKTSVQVVNGETSVRYHSTDVVCFDWKKITLRSGGWRTVTTKLRMNQASNQFDLGYSVYQEKGDWYVVFGSTTYDFKDGMTLDRLTMKVA